MKQPHEDITGTLRDDDDLLSLDERAMPVRAALVILTRHLSTATLVGNPAPVVARMSDRLRTPQVGDLVAESTTLMRAGARSHEDWYRGFGYLVEHRIEWWTTDEQWEADNAEDEYLKTEDRMTDHAWYVQYGPDPADVCRWVNCDFLVVPIDQRTFSQPIGRVDGTGVTINRDDLLGGLADSGFTLRTPHA